MAECEVCGSKNACRRARIEGIILTVCDKCVRLGEEIPLVEVKQIKKPSGKIEEMEEVVKDDFHKTIRLEREKRKLMQEELAKKINEKVSIIKRIEEGWEPPLNILRKIEKFFNISLTEIMQEKPIEKKGKKEKLTIGDVVEIR